MKKSIIALIIVIVVIIIVGSYFYQNHKAQIQQVAATPAPTPDISFPLGGEKLIKGKTYTITWNAAKIEATSTQLFLIDNSLAPIGGSVSISDRVYNIPNSGSYSYTIPVTLPDKAYKFEIGELTSNPFTISL